MLYNNPRLSSPKFLSLIRDFITVQISGFKMASISQFPTVTRLITVNSPAGISSFLQDDTPPPVQPTGPKSQLTYLYSSPPSFSIGSDTDLAHHKDKDFRTFPAAGASCAVVVDVAPNPEGAPGMMHKTNTLDYCIVVDGELELTLYAGEGQEGEKRVVKRGEVVVQRACMHAWRNLSKTEGARMIAVAIGAEGAIEGGMEFPK